jgi:hypothetical protein
MASGCFSLWSKGHSLAQNEMELRRKYSAILLIFYDPIHGTASAPIKTHLISSLQGGWRFFSF